MTNIERAAFLLREAEENLEEVVRAWERGSWNRVVRRGQEVVELSLKAIFKLMSVEYPKVHDVAPALEEVLKGKRIEQDPSLIEEIKEISKELAKERAPAFYGEVLYKKEDAQKAKRGAEKVLSFAQEFSKELEKPIS